MRNSGEKRKRKIRQWLKESRLAKTNSWTWYILWHSISNSWLKTHWKGHDLFPVLNWPHLHSKPQWPWNRSFHSALHCPRLFFYICSCKTVLPSWWLVKFEMLGFSDPTWTGNSTMIYNITLSVAFVKIETPVLVRSLKLSILSSTSFQTD